MSSSFNGFVRFTVFGQSHSQSVGVVIEGLPAGFQPDMEKLNRFLQRRAPGNTVYSTARREEDVPDFISGLFNGKTCGAPLTAIIQNRDFISGGYREVKYKPRPGHADFTAEIKYNGFQDYTGGGHFSGRLTAPLCVVGGLCIQLLEKENIEIMSRIYEIGGIKDTGTFRESVSEKSFPVADDNCGEKMLRAIMDAESEGDSLGGIVECVVKGVPAGLGDPMFDGMENRISKLIFGIPGIKGIEFGAGFESASLRGSENNDAFCYQDGKVVTKTNNCGGILGGITDGMPIVFRTAVKPTPSIKKDQATIDLAEHKDTKLTLDGRFDPCIVPRALPCVEAAAAIAVYDAFLEKQSGTEALE